MRAEEFMNENLRKWFKEKWVRFGPDGRIRGDCARGSDSEGKPKCLPQSKAHALGKKGRASAASRKRRQDPNPERTGPAHNVATKEAANPAQQAAIAIAMKKAGKKPKHMKEAANPADTLYFFDVAQGGRSFDKLDLKIMGLKQSQKGKWYYQPGRDSTDLITNATIKHLEKTLNVPARAWKRPVQEQQLAELKCWSGYTRVPGVPAGAPGSCRKKTNEAEQCPECGGPMFSELMINEKQDACYYKVKSRYKVWPSAYASGALVQCRKKGAANWGNKSE